MLSIHHFTIIRPFRKTVFYLSLSLISLLLSVQTQLPTGNIETQLLRLGADKYRASAALAIASPECNIVVPEGHYVLVESFFANFDNVARRIAFLKAYGFQDVSYTHTTCQDFDVEKDLYIVMITKPVSNKASLYPEMESAYQMAVEKGIDLITTRIVSCRE